jgi:hypothetical protein
LIYTQFQHPAFARWQSRLARIPRWAWIAFAIGALIPIVVIFAIALVAGLMAFAVVLIVGAIIGMVLRFLRHRQHRRGQIIVRSVRIVDP